MKRDGDEIPAEGATACRRNVHVTGAPELQSI